jgi:hypothetical protein
VDGRDKPGHDARKQLVLKAPSRLLPNTMALADEGVTSLNRRVIYPAMIMIAASNYWYFSYDSSLAVGGSRSI